MFKPLKTLAALAVAGLLASPLAYAAPESGWWWNAAEGGRGFAIEVQNGKMFIAGFMYDDAGRATWHVSGPTPMVNDTTYQGNWMQYGGGQTLTGSFKPANVVNNNTGSLTIKFPTPTTATMTLPNGNQIALTRFAFGGASNTVGNVCTPANLTAQHYDAIAYGMTMAQVKQTIGCDYDPTATLMLNNGAMSYYTWRVLIPGTSASYYVINVFFDPSGSIVSDVYGGKYPGKEYFKTSSLNLVR
ncbi:hypothetical protein SAMN02745857_03596 [Andreprevotia lacus DSM 23236]|jgi:hypothetical protein|uniref:Lipoprotein n=1 Tax=Andreprevotia lacus DSM 23236 TaxID=1121001 RepID=A0A1W1XYZ9_9NEIS|nr:hypothetical protein [Andreprevotia lacus]SMC29094.1 hypothetical protein SAMN02745857_03596 [Andreprevotia lacus DSM 23236]